MDESIGLPPGTMENLGTGLGANIITVLAIGVLLLIRNCSKRKFKHSACKTICCTLELDEPDDSKSTVIDKGNPDDKKRHRDPLEIV